MKKIFSYFLALGIALCGFSSVQAADNNPYELANEVATTTINDIKANKDKLSNRAVAEGIIEKDLTSVCTYPEYTGKKKKKKILFLTLISNTQPIKLLEPL